MEKVQVEILGLSTSPASGGAFALILKETNGNRRLPVIIGAYEAQAIAIELENIKPPRPLTHDLLRTIIESLDATVSEVVINELREGTFYAKIMLDTITGVTEVDSRPSDAIALGVRFGAPIYVEEEVLREASFEPEPELQDEIDDEEIQLQKSSKRKKAEVSEEDTIKRIQAELNKAVENEDYERAIKLRDELNKLRSNKKNNLLDNLSEH